MKILIIFLSFLMATTSFAMKSEISLRKPVGAPAVLDTSSTNITSGAWVEMIASLQYACSGILIHNSGAQPIRVGVGAAASEVNLGLVIPIGVSILVPVELARLSRVSLRSMGSTQSSGIITLSCFQ